MVLKMHLLSLYNSVFLFSIMKQVSGAITPTVGFCHGEDSRKDISIKYNRTRDQGNFSCHCKVRADLIDLEDDEMYYVISSRNIKGPKRSRGGYFSISITSEGNTWTVSNETIDRDEEIFETEGMWETDISLILYPGTNTPKVLRLDLNGYGSRLNVYCGPGLGKTTTDPATSTTPKTTTTTKLSTTTIISTPPVFSTTLNKIAQSTSAISISSPGTTQAQSTAFQTKSGQKGGVNAATVAGGIVSGVAVVGIVAVTVCWYMKRNKHSENVNAPKDSHNNPLYSVTEMDSIYSVADNSENNNVLSNDSAGKPTCFQLEPSHKDTCINVAVSATKEYDHVIFQNVGLAAPSQQSFDVYDHVTDKTDTSDDCYNHAGADINQWKNVNVDYDTAASASKAVQELLNQDDYASYDHLGTPAGTTVTNSDYDTAQLK